MNHNNSPQLSPEQSPVLSEKDQKILDGLRGRKLIVVRGAGTDNRKLEGGWRIVEDSITDLDGNGVLFVTVENEDESLSKQVGLDALWHLNPPETEESNEDQNRSDLEELGSVAVEASVEENREFIRDAVLQTERLINDLEESSRKGIADLNRGLEDLQQLLRQSMNAAAEGPWSGNKISDNQEIVRAAQRVIDDLQVMVRKLFNSADSVDYVNHIARLTAAVEDRISLEATGTTEKKKLDEIRELLEDTARGIRTSSGTQELELFGRRLEIAYTMLFGSVETVDDFTSEITQLIRMLEDVSEKKSGLNTIAIRALNDVESHKKQ